MNMGGGGRYTSIVPKMPRGANSYTIFAKQHYHEIAQLNPTLQAEEVRKLMSTRWNEMSKEEQQPFANMAATQKAKALEAWNIKEPEREASRKRWCKKLELPLYSSWDDLDIENRKRFLRNLNVNFPFYC